MANSKFIADIPGERLEAVLHAGYELEALAVKFPAHDENDFSVEYVQRLIIERVKVLASVVMSALDDNRETDELRKIVGLPTVGGASRPLLLCKKIRQLRHSN